ncbi:MAG: dihydrodipicolinate synthase family protein [Candidatus Hermodarchaeota archaeon]
MINGILVPSLTFFNRNKEINIELNSILIRHVLLNGAKAIYLFGTTGEGIFFSDKLEEKIKYINLMYEINSDIPLFLGTFGNQVENIIEQIELLGKKYNKINFFIAPPFSLKVTKEELKHHFENILSSLSIKNPIYLYHNPELFKGNEIDPNIVKDLVIFSNLKGIKDASNKINNYKAYIQMLSSEFSVLCGNESNFSLFLQLIPIELRKFSGLVPSIANLVNICSKLYDAASVDNILELHKLQEQLNDVIEKIYDFKIEEGKIQRGLKYAFLQLYKDIIKTPIDELFNISPDLHRDLDDITKTRIKATTNYLLNQKNIYQLYSLTKEELFDLNDLIEMFSEVDILTKQGKIKKIIGPIDGTYNTIYRTKFENSQLIFRFRTSKLFLFENIVKEKILFPLLDGALYPFSSKLEEKIDILLRNQTGTYIFDKQNPPIIPVANLIYYDETKKLIPYIYSVQNYIRGKPLYTILRQNLTDSFNFNLSTTKFVNLFRNLGEMLGKIHTIKFNSFYETVKDIGKKEVKNWSDLFNRKLQTHIQEARTNKIENIEEISRFFKKNESLIEDDEEPVLLHNDFHSKNIIVKEDHTKITINGIIDFDNWGVGVRALDFVKILYLDLNLLNQPNLTNSFYEGYNNHNIVNNDFKKKIEYYSLYWLIERNNYEARIKKESQNNKKSIQKFLQLIS